MNKFQWYINRLSLMSLSEILYRFKGEIAKKTADKNPLPLRPPLLMEEKKVCWYWDALQPQGLWDEAYAKELLNHQFSFFSFDKKDFGQKIDWHQDYKSGKRTPLAFSPDIDYRQGDRIGDIKYIWEINRHQHLVTLAQAYYLTGKQEYKEEIYFQINDWIDANPYLKGVNWINGFEAGIRLISWSWVWMLVGDLDESFKAKWLESIYAHCHFTSRHFSKYSSANNHLIGEAAGLFIASLVWPFEGKSDQWAKKSFDVLVEEMDHQNFSDGVNKEQAVFYQQFVLDHFILAGLLGQKNGFTFSKGYWDRIEAMLEFFASLMDQNGNIPVIGDADDGFAVILSSSQKQNPYKPLLATGAVLFDRADFKSKAGEFDAKSFWLLGDKGKKKFDQLDVKEIISKKLFPQGGYYILSDEEGTEQEIKSIFDCAPLGYLSIAAHGHADALSLTLNVSGKEFLIDPGIYAYHTQRQWRDYFKGTSAHNTIRIDQKDQSVSGGNFMWVKKAKANLISWESEKDYDRIVAEHTGYLRLVDPVKHQREVYFDKQKKFFKIVDHVSAKKEHFIEQFFHFSKDCRVKEIEPGKWEVANNDVFICMHIDGGMTTTIVQGSCDPILGWESKRFDRKTLTTTMVNTYQGKGIKEFVTYVFINKRGKENEN